MVQLIFAIVRVRRKRRCNAMVRIKGLGHKGKVEMAHRNDKVSCEAKALLFYRRWQPGAALSLAGLLDSVTD